MQATKITPMTAEQRAGRLAQYIAEHDTTRSSVAKALGVSGGMLTRLVNGERTPRSRQVALARLINVPVQKLFGPPGRTTSRTTGARRGPGPAREHAQN